ncbi:MAG: hypothetical protein AB2A00_22370 [Myxococcota bacterium]
MTWEVGPATPGTWGEAAAGVGGGVTWADPGGALRSDTDEATVTLAPSVSSTFLVVTDFGFALPTDAVIVGIEVMLEGDSDNQTIKDRDVTLVLGGALVGSNRALGTPWNGGPQDHGGPTDTWGATWTAADINRLDFGVAVSVMTQAGAPASDTAYLDTVRITVHYDVNANPESRTQLGDVATADGLLTSARWQDLPAAAMADGNPASVDVSETGWSTYLVASGLGFNLPADAVILGISATVLRRGEGEVEDSSVRLVKAGVVTGRESATAGPWPVDNTVAGYGGEGDLWNVAWDPADVNRPDFGLALAVKRGASAAQGVAHVDAVTVTVHYGHPSVAGPLSPGRVVNVPVTFFGVWSAPQNARVADGTFANASLFGIRTDDLVASEFGFALPEGAVVRGVRADLLVKGVQAADQRVRLVVDGVEQGTARVAPDAWSDIPTVMPHGGGSDLWDHPWSLAEIHDPGFGLVLAARYVGSGMEAGSASVDHIQLTVYYDVCAP